MMAHSSKLVLALAYAKSHLRRYELYQRKMFPERYEGTDDPVYKILKNMPDIYTLLASGSEDTLKEHNTQLENALNEVIDRTNDTKSSD